MRGVFLFDSDGFGVVCGCIGDVGWRPVGFSLDMDWIWAGYGSGMDRARQG